MSVVLAETNRALTRDLGGILAASVLLLLGAWFGADVFVLGSIRTLVGVARQVQAGRLDARTGLAHGKDELAQLGAVFDNMAGALQQRDADMRRVLQEVQEQAVTDPLSGLYNRRFLFDLLPRELTRVQRKKLPLAVMMIDIDYFKRVNDRYGHEAGDLTIKAVAQAIKSTLRSSDYTCRYGGEEFAVVLPELPVEGASVRAEAIRATVEALKIKCPGSRQINVTVSIGIAASPDHGSNADLLLRAADEALYEAKGAGRNRVVVHAAPDRQEVS
jgi:diguanylate cyclase (GGDEF)-like protein